MRTHFNHCGGQGDAKFMQKVDINTVVKTPAGRFGVDQNHIQRFIQCNSVLFRIKIHHPNS